MCIILIGAPYATASLVLNNQLRLRGNAVYAMIGLVLRRRAEHGARPAFIFTFGMGIRGAALATILVNSRHRLLLKPAYRAASVSGCACFRPRPPRYAPTSRAAEFRACRQGSYISCRDLPQYGAALWRDTAIAAMSIVSRTSTSSQLRDDRLQTKGFQPVCGFNFGAHKGHDFV